MKINLVLVLLCFSVAAFAQEEKRDSTQKEKKSIKLTIGVRDTVKIDTIKPSSKFSVQLTFARIDLGLAKFTDNGSFTLSPATQLLETITFKTHNFGFEFFQMGYRFNHYFKVYLGSGIDWTHMRFKKDITIQPDKPKFEPVEESVDFEKNRFSSTYLRIPLAFQLRTKDDRKGNKVHFVFGPEVGFLINGKTKQVSDERGKQKVKDDFNLNPFRYGASARLGYGSFGVYVKYYDTDVFADNQGPQGFKNMNFGVMLGW
ncbi:MAG TPA: porin family protein [Pedobacter sp.]|jgi:hypothetical protein